MDATPYGGHRVSTEEASRYRVLERIGEGTFGEVHKAEQVDSGRLVALKKVRLRNVEEGGCREQRRVAFAASLRTAATARLLQVVRESMAYVGVVCVFRVRARLLVRRQGCRIRH